MVHGHLVLTLHSSVETPAVLVGDEKIRSAILKESPMSGLNENSMIRICTVKNHGFILGDYESLLKQAEHHPKSRIAPANFALRHPLVEGDAIFLVKPFGKNKQVPVMIDGVMYLRQINNLEITKDTLLVTRAVYQL